MTESLTFFDSVEDIEKLTGLTEDELWNQGFNLDDMDWGFVTDHTEYMTITKDEYGWPEHKVNEVPQYIDQILWMMDDYCVGYSATIYDNKLWITLHHS